MNDELKKALETFILKLTDLVNSGTDQLPGVLQDIVGWEILEGAIVNFFGLMFLGLGMWTIRRRKKISPCTDPNLYELSGLAGVLIIILGVISLIKGIPKFFYAYLFPRLVILDYLKGLF